MSLLKIKHYTFFLLLVVAQSAGCYALDVDKFKVDISNNLIIKTIYINDIELVSDCMLKMQSFENNKIITKDIQKLSSGGMSKKNGNNQLKNSFYGKWISWDESITRNNNKLDIEYSINVTKDIENSIIYISCLIPNGNDFHVAEARNSNKQIYYKTNLGLLTFVYTTNDSYLATNRNVLRNQMRLVLNKSNRRKSIDSGNYKVKYSILLPDLNDLRVDRSAASYADLVKIGFAKQNHNKTWLFEPNTKTTITTPITAKSSEYEKLDFIWEITDYYDNLVSRVTETKTISNDKVSYTFKTPKLYGPYRLTLTLSNKVLNSHGVSVSKDIAVFGVINPLWGSKKTSYGQDEFVGAIIHGGGSARFKTAHDLGIRWKRCEFEVSWTFNSHEPYVYNFNKDGIKKVNDAGLHCLGQLAYSPAYSVDASESERKKYKYSKSLHHPLSHSMPDEAMFEDYVRKVVSLYNDDLQYWELWNEPNSRQFFTGSPEQYMSLLRITKEVLDELNPKAKLVAPSTANMVGIGKWSSELLELGALSYIDIWGYHRYINDPYFDAQQYHNDILSLKFALNRSGGSNLELWNTEGGTLSQTMFRDSEFSDWPHKSTRKNRDPLSGFILPKMFAIEMSENVKKHFIYFLKSTKEFSGLSLLEFNNSSKDILFPIAAWMGLIDGSAFVERKVVDDVVNVYIFKRNTKYIAMMWANLKPEKAINLPYNEFTGITFYDSLGNTMLGDRENLISVVPIYAEVSSDKIDKFINSIQHNVKKRVI